MPAIMSRKHIPFLSPTSFPREQVEKYAMFLFEQGDK